jgi:hypothetical protein
MKYVEMRNDLKYNLVYDIDDYVWDYNELQGGSKDLGVPSYNPAYKNVTKEHKDNSIEIMKNVDTITVSTQGLKDYIENTLKISTKVKLLKNAIPFYLWGTSKKNPIKEDLKKPKVIYTGSPTHYKNPTKQDPSKSFGDFDSAWKDWKFLRDHLKFPSAMRSTGGDPLPGGDFLGGTFFLQNGWRILVKQGPDNISVVGNIYTEEGDAAFVTESGVQLLTARVSNLIDKPDLGIRNASIFV